jgi:hypothetical protein
VGARGRVSAKNRSTWGVTLALSIKEAVVRPLHGD